MFKHWSIVPKFTPDHKCEWCKDVQRLDCSAGLFCSVYDEICEIAAQKCTLTSSDTFHSSEDNQKVPTEGFGSTPSKR